MTKKGVQGSYPYLRVSVVRLTWQLWAQLTEKAWDRLSTKLLLTESEMGWMNESPLEWTHTDTSGENCKAEFVYCKQRHSLFGLGKADLSQGNTWAQLACQMSYRLFFATVFYEDLYFMLFISLSLRKNLTLWEKCILLAPFYI